MSIMSNQGAQIVNWGTINGNITSQTDLQTSINNIAALAGMLQESKYTATLLFAPPPRQANAVKDFSQNLADGQYLGDMTDAEIYDTEPGWLSTGMSTGKALFIHSSNLNWNLANNQSLLIQMQFKFPSVGTTTVDLFRNRVLW